MLWPRKKFNSVVRTLKMYLFETLMDCFFSFVCLFFDKSTFQQNFSIKIEFYLVIVNEQDF